VRRHLRQCVRVVMPREPSVPLSSVEWFVECVKERDSTATMVELVCHDASYFEALMRVGDERAADNDSSLVMRGLRAVVRAPEGYKRLVDACTWGIYRHLHHVLTRAEPGDDEYTSDEAYRTRFRIYDDDDEDAPLLLDRDSVARAIALAHSARAYFKRVAPPARVQAEADTGALGKALGELTQSDPYFDNEVRTTYLRGIERASERGGPIAHPNPFED